MSRRLITVAFFCALLAALPPSPAAAATGKSSTKKSSTTSKKKPVADTRKTSAKEGADTAEKSGTEKALDLPLPEKPAASGETETSNADKASSDKMKGSSSGAKSTGGTKQNSGVSSPGAGGPDKADSESPAKLERAPNATVEPEAIAEFASQPPRIQQLIRDAVDLTRLNLTYTFGSADPDNGGMDCSGTMYYLLRAHGFDDVARDSSGQYLWARKSGAFFPVLSKNAESAEFKELLPGDLMFWTGTYETSRDIPISHVMLYLGREKATGKRIMFGASDGRSYNGVQRWGVSVFDFKMPKSDPADAEKAKVDFVGYARISGLRGGGPATDESPTPTTTTAAKATPTPTPRTASAKTSAKKKSRKR